jgi:hypothetical protein
MEDKVVYDVDGVQYSFLSEEIADPFIKDMTDLPAMAVSMVKDMINRMDSKAQGAQGK